MRKFTSFFLFFALSALLFAEELKLVSFNMGARSRTASQVAEMIETSGADIVCVQEIYLQSEKDDAAKKITAHLSKKNQKWEYLSTSGYLLQNLITIKNETFKTGGNGQNNAIFFNKDTLQAEDLAGEAGFTEFGSKKFDPATVSEEFLKSAYLFDKNNVQLVKITPVSSPEKPFILMNAHLPYTDKEHRKRDLASLERLFSKYKLKFPVILAGDFNTHRKDLAKRNFDIVDGTESWYYDPNFGLPTTLSTKGESEIIFANDYDHFVMNKKVRVVEKMHRLGSDSNSKTEKEILFGRAAYTNSISFRKEISDHSPITITIETDGF